MLLSQINAQLIDHGVLVKQGAIIDASVTETPRKAKGKSTYTLTGDQQTPLKKELPASVDKEASWVKKNGKLLYGYKRHYLSDSREGLVLSVHTTAAHVHESKHLKACLSNSSLLPGVVYWLIRVIVLPLMSPYNKEIGQDGYKIERVFGSIKRWFGGLHARYVGLLKMHGQHVLEGMGYNLYRLPGLILSNG